ncbi:hypothetical protein GC098_18725 [Paenibacillus sp. LMG 31458]|uniref:Uncharacterized protein n=1 Tax=Paenibacillus phytorum TaxID=2654977 RepID=A0ABX1XZI8_9BACL|nr:hypothetical protein [Paenibacillus phytorum]NOU73431.1 hypothetical protein [Paenibacillus phytorum]
MNSCSCNGSTTLACNISQIDPLQKTHYFNLRKDLTENLQVEEISCGYTFVFENTPTMLLKIAEWITFENLCCPFIRFSLHISGDDPTIRLDMTGNDQVKSLIQNEFNIA